MAITLKDIAGSVVAIVLLWFPTLAVHVPGYMLADDGTQVLIYDGCLGTKTVTVFTFCMIEMVLATWFLGKYFLPSLFGHDDFARFDTLKQQKLIGFIAQIVVRAKVFWVLALYVAPYLSLEEGLFAKFNMKAAREELIKHEVVTTCHKAGMDAQAIHAYSSWALAKYHMVAVHIWELSFIPGLSIDGWLHHLFVVLVATIIGQPLSLTGNLQIQPLIDLVGFSFILGASLNSLVKSCVVMYHYTAPRALTQARWMEASITGACLITMFAYLGFPLWQAIWHAKSFGSFTTIFVVLIPITFLVVVEIRLVFVKLSISRKARRKAQETMLPGGIMQSDNPASVGSRSPTHHVDESSRPSSMVGAGVPMSSLGRLASVGTIIQSWDASLNEVSDAWKETQC